MLSGKVVLKSMLFHFMVGKMSTKSDKTFTELL